MSYVAVRIPDYYIVDDGLYVVGFYKEKYDIDTPAMSYMSSPPKPENLVPVVTQDLINQDIYTAAQDFVDKYERFYEVINDVWESRYPVYDNQPQEEYDVIKDKSFISAPKMSGYSTTMNGIPCYDAETAIKHVHFLNGGNRYGSPA